MENKPNRNKNSLRVKNQLEMASDDIIDNTPTPSKIFNTPAEAYVIAPWEKSITEDSKRSHINHTPQIEAQDLRDLTTVVETINNLKPEIETLKEFIIE